MANVTEEVSTSDALVLCIQTGLWCGILTAIVLYKIVRAVSPLNALFECCLTGNPHVEGDGCNPCFFVLVWTAGYCYLFFKLAKSWTPAIVHWVISAFFMANVLVLVVLLTWSIKESRRRRARQHPTSNETQHLVVGTTVSVDDGAVTESSLQIQQDIVIPSTSIETTETDPNTLT